jgi:hypothetical protein
MRGPGHRGEAHDVEGAQDAQEQGVAPFARPGYMEAAADDDGQRTRLLPLPPEGLATP